MAEKQSLPTVLRLNPKDVLVQGLRGYLSRSDLKAPIDVTKDFPSKETWAADERGVRVPRRRIVVKKLKNTPILQSIGDAYTGEFSFFPQTDDLDTLAAVKGQGMGWIDLYTFEVSAWTTDSDDRDNLIELIKLMMLELTQGRTENSPTPYFLANGVLAVKFVSESDSMDTRVIQNGVMYSGSTTWNLIVPFYNFTTEQYRRIKVGLLQEIINYNPDTGTGNPGVPPGSGGGVIIIDPQIPGGGGTGDGGSNSQIPNPNTNNNEVKTHGTLVIPIGASNYNPVEKDVTTITVGSGQDIGGLNAEALLEHFKKE